MLPEPLDELFLIHHDDQPAARCGNDLFAQQGASETLDQIEGAELDLVRAVDSQIETLIFSKGCDRNAESPGLDCRALGGRNAHHPEPCGNTPRQPFDHKGSRRPGSEPEDHAVLDFLDRTHGCCAL